MGPPELVSVTSDDDGEQLILAIVQRSTTTPLMPVTLVVGEFGLTIVGVIPETTVQVPVPTVGVLACMVADVPQPKF